MCEKECREFFKLSFPFFLNILKNRNMERIRSANSSKKNAKNILHDFLVRSFIIINSEDCGNVYRVLF